MNNKGLTIIELITSFMMASIIIVLLVNVILILKNLYSSTSVKTELYIRQANLSKALNEKINFENLNSYEMCDATDSCYIFYFVDGEEVKLEIKDNVLTFGSFTYKLMNGNSFLSSPISITKESVNVVDPNANNSFLIIKIPIKNKLYPIEDFGINLIYPYNSNKIVL